MSAGRPASRRRAELPPLIGIGVEPYYTPKFFFSSQSSKEANGENVASLSSLVETHFIMF
jgi:hypothetical protein